MQNIIFNNKTNNNKMKTIKKFTVLILVMNLFLATSCSNDVLIEPINTHDDAYGDVILKKINVQGVIKYKLIFFAGAIDLIATNSKVTFPDGTTELTLENFWAGSGKLRNMTSPILLDRPASGEFTFTLNFSDGYTKIVTDTLESTEIDLPMPLVATYTSGENSMTVSWDAVQGADLYCVKITDIDMLTDKPLFKKSKIETTATSITINFDGGNGWMRPTSDLVIGTEYWVVIAAKKVENGTTVSGASKNFQTSACIKTKITF